MIRCWRNCIKTMQMVAPVYVEDAVKAEMLILTEIKGKGGICVVVV